MCKNASEMLFNFKNNNVGFADAADLPKLLRNLLDLLQKYLAGMFLCLCWLFDPLRDLVGAPAKLLLLVPLLLALRVPGRHCSVIEVAVQHLLHQMISATLVRILERIGTYSLHCSLVPSPPLCPLGAQKHNTIAMWLKLATRIAHIACMLLLTCLLCSTTVSWGFACALLAVCFLLVGYQGFPATFVGRSGQWKHACVSMHVLLSRLQHS